MKDGPDCERNQNESGANNQKVSSIEGAYDDGPGEIELLLDGKSPEMLQQFRRKPPTIKANWPVE